MPGRWQTTGTNSAVPATKNGRQDQCEYGVVVSGSRNTVKTKMNWSDLGATC